jgi:hypothetical protein
MRRIHPHGVADGQLGEWLANLSRARALLTDVATLHPGHGRSGGLALLDTQRRYLEAYGAAVRELGDRPEGART